MITATSFVFYGQTELGIKANAGISKVELIGDFRSMTSNSRFDLSGQGGLYCNFHTGKRSLLGAELLLSQVRGKEEMRFTFTNSSGIPVHRPEFIFLEYSVSYLVLPIYYGFKIQDITITLGGQPGFVLTESFHQETTNLSLFPLGKPMKLNPFNIGPKAGLFYEFAERFSVETTFYYGLVGTFRSRWDWKIRQITFGLRYSIINTDKNDSNLKRG